MIFLGVFLPFQIPPLNDIKGPPQNNYFLICVFGICLSILWFPQHRNAQNSGSESAGRPCITPTDERGTGVVSVANATTEQTFCTTSQAPAQGAHELSSLTAKCHYEKI